MSSELGGLGPYMPDFSSDRKKRTHPLKSPSSAHVSIDHTVPRSMTERQVDPISRFYNPEVQKTEKYKEKAFDLTSLSSDSLSSISPITDMEEITSSEASEHPKVVRRDSNSTASPSLSDISSNVSLSSADQRIIDQLQLRDYSPKVQKKIVDCFLSKSPYLDLHGCNLTTVPPCISTHLAHVVELNLSDNHITAFDADLPNLTFLNLRANRLSTFTANLPNLKELNLSKNLFSSFIARTEQFPKLTSLNLSRNTLTKFEGSLLELEQLTLSHNQFTTFPPTPKQLPKLTHLNLSDNKLDAMCSTKFPNLTHLTDDFSTRRAQIKELKLEGYSVDVQNKIIDCYLRKTDSLDLSRCELKTIPKCLSKFSWVTSLNLSQNQIDTVRLSLPYLEVLNLSGNQLIGFSGDREKFPRLKDLDLSFNKLDRFVANPPELQKLNLSGNKFKVFAPPRGNLSRLESLDISLNYITSVDLSLSRLRQLNLAHNLMREVVLNSTNTPDLIEMDLSYNDIYFTDIQLSRLQKLILTHNKNLSAFPDNFSRLPNLTHLNILDCPVYINPRTVLQELRQETPSSVKNKLIKILEIEEYSPAVQNAIINCFQSGRSSLNLRNLELETIPRCLSSHLALTDLDLSGNNLTEFPLEMPFLLSLNLSDNQFQTFSAPKNQFPCLQSIDLSYNWIRKSDVDIEDESVTVDISHCLLDSKEIKEKTPRETLRQRLDIASYSREVQEKILDCLISENPVLNLERCGLKTIPVCLSRDFPFLTDLNLSHNQISSFSLTNPSLVNLDLSHNKLKEFSTSIEELPNLEEVTLSYNDLDDHHIEISGLDIIPVNEH